VSRRKQGRPKAAPGPAARPSAAAAGPPAPGADAPRTPPAPPGETPVEPQVPLFELLPAFEEEGGVSLHPTPVTRAVLDERSAPGEQCRLLGERVRALGRDKRLRRVGVAGGTAGEGSSTVAIGLARALSRARGTRVLLVELDLLRPALDAALGLRPPAVGLRQFLEGRADVPVLRRAPGEGFWLLSAGAATGRGGRGSPRRGSRPCSARPTGCSTTASPTARPSSARARRGRRRSTSTASSSWCGPGTPSARPSSGPRRSSAGTSSSGSSSTPGATCCAAAPGS
jgi:hypothetical protein